MRHAHAELADAPVAAHRGVGMTHNALDLLVAHRVIDHRGPALRHQVQDGFDFELQLLFAPLEDVDFANALAFERVVERARGHHRVG